MFCASGGALGADLALILAYKGVGVGERQGNSLMGGKEKETWRRQQPWSFRLFAPEVAHLARICRESLPARGRGRAKVEINGRWARIVQQRRTTSNAPAVPAAAPKGLVVLACRAWGWGGGVTRV